MAEIKADTTHQHNVSVLEDDVPVQKLQKPKRVASLDIFRGLTVAVLINHFLILVFEFSCSQVLNFILFQYVPH